MESGKQTSDKFKELRLKAEEKLDNTFNNKDEAVDPNEVLSIKRLIHELQVYQTELEMQNDELKNTQEKLRESEKQYEELYDSAPISYLSLDKNGRILNSNHRAAQKFQTERGYLIDKSLYDFIEMEERDQLYLHLVNVQKDEEVHQCELQIHVANIHNPEKEESSEKQGDTFWALLESKYCKVEGGNTFCRTVLSDITERRRMESELSQAKEKAEENDYLKSAFLANMSHEIRTPINGIFGFTDMLMQADLNSEERNQYIDIIHKSGKRLLNTVNDIIEISKIESRTTTVDPAETDINRKLEDLTQFFASEAQEKGLTLTLDHLLPENHRILLIDESKLESILTNLIKNAIKYTDEGEIHIGCLKKGASIEFYVADTGIGIPQDRQDAIFNRFEQADISDKRAFEGSGIGLALIKSYLEMLGGSMRLDSKEGEGSTFYVSLPYLPPEKKETVPQNSNLTASNTYDEAAIRDRKLNILVAEDDDASFLVLDMLLKKLNCKIIHAKSGNEAIEQAYLNPDLDLILMDIKMPEMDGYEATSKIREFNKKIYIIAQTAYALEGDKEKSLSAGINDYITKPVQSESLMQAIYKGMFAE